MLQHSALCEGTIYHVRQKPRRHAFQYKSNMVWLDLDEIDQLSAMPFWSATRRALTRFYRSDYLAPHTMELQQAVYHLLTTNSIVPEPGRVVLLTQLRSWGHSFNPVSFYFCYNQSNELYAIVAEITNTPWRERHQYVLRCDQLHKYYFEFDKQFHVSPFMPMTLRYFWNFRLEGDSIAIDMSLKEGKETVFRSALNLRKKPLTRARAACSSVLFPFRCLRVLAAIYWQALRLWLKKIPQYDHPESADSASHH